MPEATVLGVITARGGSKGIPGKNLKPLAGRPLIVHTIETARASGVFDRLIVSTDDDAIAAVAHANGCDVPFLRPAALAADETPHLPVMQHAVAWLKEHERYAAPLTMVLQPTSPLRRAVDIQESVRLIETTGADSVVSVSAVPDHWHPMRAVRVDASGTATLFVTGEPIRRRINRRQDLPPAWVLNGAIYLFRTALLFSPQPSLYGDRTAAYPMPEPYGISIDDLDDWREAEDALGRERTARK